MIPMDKKNLQQHLKNTTTLTTHYRMTRKDIFIGSLRYLYIVGLFLLFVSSFYKIDQVFSLNTPVLQLMNLVTQSIFSCLIFIFILAVSIICIASLILHIKYRHYEIAADKEYIYIHNKSGSYFMIPRKALHSILIKKSMTQRPFQLITVKLHYITETHKKNSIQSAILIPFIHKHKGIQLIEEIQPDFFLQESFLTLSGEAYFVELIQPSYVLVILTFFIMFFWPELWFVPILYALYLIIKRIMKTRQQRVNWSNDIITIRSGSFSSTLHIVKREEITMIQIQQSWIQRKLKLATCQLTTQYNTILLNHLNEAIVEQLYNWFIQDDVR